MGNDKMSELNAAELKRLLTVFKQPTSASIKKMTKKEKGAFKNSIFELRVWASDWVGHTRGMPSRDIAVRGDSDLDDLAADILDSFEFDNDHLYMFSDNIKNPYKGIEKYEAAPMDDVFGDKIPLTRAFIVAQVFNAPKKKMLFLFDYGDEWRFVVQLLGTRDAKNGENYPLVTNIKGEAPKQYEEYDEEED